MAPQQEEAQWQGRSILLGPSLTEWDDAEDGMGLVEVRGAPSGLLVTFATSRFYKMNRTTHHMHVDERGPSMQLWWMGTTGTTGNAIGTCVPLLDVFKCNTLHSIFILLDCRSQVVP